MSNVGTTTRKVRGIIRTAMYFTGFVSAYTAHEAARSARDCG